MRIQFLPTILRSCVFLSVFFFFCTFFISLISIILFLLYTCIHYHDKALLNLNLNLISTRIIPAIKTDDAAIFVTIWNQRRLAERSRPLENELLNFRPRRLYKRLLQTSQVGSLMGKENCPIIGLFRIGTNITYVYTQSNRSFYKMTIQSQVKSMNQTHVTEMQINWLQLKKSQSYSMNK